MSIPDSLRDPALMPLWRSCRQRLDRYGPDYRGSLRLPDLSDHALLTLDSLLDKPHTTRVALPALEEALVFRGVATDLSKALTRLGAPENTVLAVQRAAAEQRKNARIAVDAEVAVWSESWQHAWVSWLFRSSAMTGVDATAAVAQVQQVRALIDTIESVDDSLSRNDLAATLFGNAHALDDGCVLERSARRALWHRLGECLDYQQGRLIWNATGIMTDRVSAPVLTWRLKLLSSTPLGRLCDAANAARIPLHLSLQALSELDITTTAPTQTILVVENPRLLEVAADRQLPKTVIATNGNPSTAVTTLLQALIDQRHTLHYHGDFDTAGIAICHRMTQLGCQPWRMNSTDYVAAIEKAQAMDINLPIDDKLCGETPWDPSLQHAMRKHRKVVHEEFLIDEVLL
ncbi:hypothetical protein AB833_04900 [Chromatiales bacterium (ex Bugula neritina AB1)]|nr:hypothetical protein AB833_04900 [Chromatiales bacterium (ex Bugula neritina AB1)]